MSHDKEKDTTKPQIGTENTPTSNELTDADLDQVSGGSKGVDTRIKFDGVDGESSHKDHKGEIELLSWS